MSVPTTRPPRAPLVRNARRSAAVPGAPEAVTRTVMSRISRAMLLTVDTGVNQLQERIDLEGQSERGRQRHPVGDDVDELDHRLERDIGPDLAVLLPGGEERFGLPRLIRRRIREVSHQLRIRAQA